MLDLRLRIRRQATIGGETVSGLPTADFQNGGTYTYRVRELQPKAGGYGINDPDIANIIVGDEGTFMSGNNDYTTTYDPQGGIPNGTSDNTVTVTNTLITTPPTDETKNIRAEKVWCTDPNGNDAWPDDVTVTLVLQRSTDQTSWTDVADQLKTLSGDSPTAEWNELPSRQNEQYLYYRVVEQTPDGYIQLPVQETTTGDITVFTFTNVAPTSFTVKKNWVNNSAPEGEQVTVGLYAQRSKPRLARQAARQYVKRSRI